MRGACADYGSQARSSAIRHTRTALVCNCPCCTHMYVICMLIPWYGMVTMVWANQQSQSHVDWGPCASAVYSVLVHNFSRSRSLVVSDFTQILRCPGHVKTQTCVDRTTQTLCGIRARSGIQLNENALEPKGLTYACENYRSFAHLQTRTLLIERKLDHLSHPFMVISEDAQTDRQTDRCTKGVWNL